MFKLKLLIYKTLYYLIIILEKYTLILLIILIIHNNISIIMHIVTKINNKRFYLKHIKILFIY